MLTMATFIVAGVVTLLAAGAAVAFYYWERRVNDWNITLARWAGMAMFLVMLILFGATAFGSHALLAASIK